MNGETIKSFLVGLGFGVDETSLAKFNKSIQSASIRVAALYAGVQAAAVGIFYSISKISQGFEDMGYEYRLIAPAANKFLLLRQAMLDAYSRAGVNLQKVIQQSIMFNISLQKTKFAFQAIAGSVASKFFPLLIKQMDMFRGKIYANMPKIQVALERFVNFIFKAFDATVHLGTTIWGILQRVWDFFSKLSDATGGWSTYILAAVAAWKLLNLEFLATPLGMILAGLLAIVTLYDDFKTQQEGGQSLFDWNTGSLKGFVDLLASMRDLLFTIYDLFKGIFSLDMDTLKTAFSEIAQVFRDLETSITEIVKGFHIGWIDKLLSLRDSADSFAPGGGGSYFSQGNFAQPSPLGVGPQNQNNQTINQHNQISYSGVPDAHVATSSMVDGLSQISTSIGRNASGPK